MALLLRFAQGFSYAILRKSCARLSSTGEYSEPPEDMPASVITSRIPPHLYSPGAFPVSYLNRLAPPTANFVGALLSSFGRVLRPPASEKIAAEARPKSRKT